MDRRTFLKHGAVSISLPLLNAMLPRGLRADTQAAAMAPKRLVLVGRNLGLHAPFFFPEQPGPDYQPSRYLRLLDDHRSHFTVFSGMSHLGYGSHHCEKGLFTGVAWEHIRNPQADVRNSISLDQFVAPHLGGATRFSNLVLGHSENQLSWTSKGVPVPTDRHPNDTFRQLFLNGSPQEIAREIRRLKNGKSILDEVHRQARTLSLELGNEDRDRIDLLLSSIREAEKSLERSQAWAAKPKPKVDFQLPREIPRQQELNERESLWYDLVRLALHTDSVRVILLALTEVGRAKIDGFTGASHHEVSHHGKDPEKIEQLALIEEAEIRQLNRFLALMKSSEEAGRSLLDSTVVLSASNLGNASAHTGDNLPILLAGGGFRHQGHLAFDTQKNTPFSNLFVRILHQLGIEEDRFGASTGVLSQI
jgi:hypothetical protein